MPLWELHVVHLGPIVTYLEFCFRSSGLQFLRICFNFRQYLSALTPRRLLLAPSWLTRGSFLVQGPADERGRRGRGRRGRGTKRAGTKRERDEEVAFRSWVGLGSVLGGSGVRLVWVWGRSWVGLGSILGGSGIGLGWVWGRSWMGLGSVLGGSGIGLGWTWGRSWMDLGLILGGSGIGLGRVWGRSWVNLRSTPDGSKIDPRWI